MNDLHDLEVMLRAETPILLIESLEEPRLIDLLGQIGFRLGLPIYCWTLTDGLRPLGARAAASPAHSDPPDLLRHIKVTAGAGLYLLLDFHPFLEHPLHVRLLKEIAQGFSDAAPRRLVLISHALESPPELRHLCARFEVRLPDRQRLLALIREEAQRWQQADPSRSFRASRSAVEQLSRNLLGVAESDARRLIRNAITKDGAITESDVTEVTRAKYQLLSPEGAVAFEYDTASFAEVAGLHRLKAWVDLRRQPFLAAERGADRPKGVMLLGVQGGGKSLAAKAIAGRLGVPLLRLDVAGLYDKYIGETERKLREALRTADVMAPCVLWCDEIEKGLATDAGAEGPGRRLLGTLLTWMAERKSAVFMVATANDIARLPPELIRKGRMDEIFFVDLPDKDVRLEILMIHLKKRGLEPQRFDLDALADASEGFTGAGIEQAVVSAIYAARAANQEPDSDAIRGQLAATQPLSVVMEAQIAELRQWAQRRTVLA